MLYIINRKIYIHPKSENWYKNLVIQLVKQLVLISPLKNQIWKAIFDLEYALLNRLVTYNFPFFLTNQCNSNLLRLSYQTVRFVGVSQPFYSTNG
jgi:hypothetical protein